MLGPVEVSRFCPNAALLDKPVSATRRSAFRNPHSAIRNPLPRVVLRLAIGYYRFLD